MSKFGINEASDKEEYSIWVPSDSPHDYMLSFGYSKCLDEDVKKVLDLGFRHAFEHDLYGEIYHSRIANIFKGSDLLSDVTPDPLCYSDEIIIGNPEDNHAISLSNTAGLLVSLAVGTLLAGGMLVRETSCRRYFKPSKRKRKPLSVRL
ncbi:hypothetical protein HDE_04337 [Halotydeus destructor]|nr:hypothetical protein HDE_04337 [Halotydeus destructor]